MPELNPEQVKEWIEILGKPTAGLLAFIFLILWREAGIHIVKGLADVIFSWLKRK